MTTGWNRPTKVIVNKQAIIDNITQERLHLKESQELYAVVKANGYGHGAIEVMKAAEQAGVDGYCVAILDEGIELRQAGCQKPILVMGVTGPHLVELALEYDLTLTVASIEWFEEVMDLVHTQLIHLEDCAAIKIHVKFDTGMGRIGLTTDEEILLLNKIQKDSQLFEIVGVFTHFATADSTEEKYFNEQVETFQTFLNLMEHKPNHVHVANSATALWHPTIETTLVRLGVAMYGLNPAGRKKKSPLELKPAMSVETEIVHIKEVPAGRSVSYGATYETTDREWIGTLPIGYADGWRRDLQGFKVLVEGNFCEIIGRICMDQCMIRLPFAFPVGTKVTLIGENKKEQLTTDEIAEKLGTINYEVVCDFSERIPRIYREEQ